MAPCSVGSRRGLIVPEVVHAEPVEEDEDDGHGQGQGNE